MSITNQPRVRLLDGKPAIARRIPLVAPARNERIKVVLT
jgi:hypothetical protein